MLKFTLFLKPNRKKVIELNNRCVFRGKQDTKNETELLRADEWICGSYITDKKAPNNNDNNNIELNHYIITWAYIDLNIATNNTLATAVRIIPETVSQCTGFKDKNGTLIFEGDILEICTGVKNFVCRVRWSNSYSQFIISDTDTMFDESEPLSDYIRYSRIIGNKWDNPELLMKYL